VALSAIESPENWFEDFGTGKLSSGVATVMLDATFRQTVNTGMSYHVFLTPEGNCRGLYVTRKTPRGFEVRELRGGKSNVRFDYRIVARRKGFEAIRLADMTERYSQRSRIDIRCGAEGSERLPKISLVCGWKDAGQKSLSAWELEVWQAAQERAREEIAHRVAARIQNPSTQ
jgi:hypothetical protein